MRAGKVVSIDFTTAKPKENPMEQGTIEYINIA